MCNDNNCHGVTTHLASLDRALAKARATLDRLDRDDERLLTFASTTQTGGQR